MPPNDPTDDLTSSDAPGGKYLQLLVPDYGTTPPLTFHKASGTWIRDTTPVSLSSFLRLGAFASGSEPATFANDLLDVIDAASPPNPAVVRAQAAAKTERATLTQASDTTANAIALAAATSLGTQADAVACAPLYAAAKSALTANASKSDSDKLDAVVQAVADAVGGVPFIDDERNRGANEQMETANGHRLTIAERVKESQRLLSKGGWRDHSDGNRVSTTYGDKVEVVRGNYRMIVLGRQDDPSMAAVSDVSGGLFDNADIGPGSISEIKWVESQDGTWRSIESSTKADTESFFYGHVREVMQGGSVTSITGREDITAVAMTKVSAAVVADMTAEFDALGSKDASLTLDAYLSQRGYVRAGADYNEARYEENKDGKTKRNPILYEQTWADAISEYTGSAKTPVPMMYSETHAAGITEYTYAGNITSTTSATGTITETTLADTIKSTTGSSSSTVSHITEQTYADHVTQKMGDWGTKLTSLLEETHTQTRFCVWEGVNTETNMGLFTEVFLGAAFSFRLGVPTVEFSLGLAAEIFLGGSLEFFAGWKTEVNLGAKTEVDNAKFVAGLKKIKAYFTEDSVAVKKTSLAAVQNLGP